MLRRTATFCAALAIHAIANAETVPWGYRDVASAFGIPAEILYAIAKTESNEKLGDGTVRPWPWTLNVAGKPERYASRNAAYQALTRHLKQGRTLIDVGLMQVNWHWHKNKLGNPWDALDPYRNIRIGSKILKQEYAQTGDWHIAIGRYHSPGNETHAARYRKMVEKRLAQIDKGSQ